MTIHSRILPGESQGHRSLAGYSPLGHKESDTAEATKHMCIIVLPQGKVYVKVIYCHPAYLTCIQSTSCKNAGLDEAQAGIKIAGRNINNLRYTDDTTLMAESKEELQSLLMTVKEESEKADKTQH